jgi:hypothetical protein
LTPIGERSIDVTARLPNHEAGVQGLSTIDALIEHGTNFRVERRAGSATFKPVDDAASSLEQFQMVVRHLTAHAGDDYAVRLGSKGEKGSNELIDTVVVILSAQ